MGHVWNNRRGNAGWIGAVLLVAPVSVYGLLREPVVLGVVVVGLGLLYLGNRTLLHHGGAVTLAAMFILAQPLTAFAFESGMGTVTVDNVVLMLLAAGRVPGWKAQSTSTRWITTLVVGWVVTFPLRISYLSAGEIPRLMVTAVSFVLVFLVARTLPRDWAALKVYAWSGFLALAVFGATAYLAAKGYIALPTRVGAAGRRDIFGVVSPYPRNYGLNVAFDAIALLAAMVTPMLAIQLFAPRRALLERLAALAALAALFYWATYLWQARGILLQILLASSLVIILTRKVLRIPAVLGIAYTATAVVSDLFAADSVSSSLRLANYTEVWTIISTRPQSLALGQNENLVYSASARHGGLAAAINPLDNAIHNAFLSALIGGGILAFLTITAAFLLGLQKAWCDWRIAPSPATTYLLVAMVVCVYEMMVEPARAQVVGNWFILGLVAAGTCRVKRGRLGRVAETSGPLNEPVTSSRQ